MIDVAAAVIENREGRILIVRRKPDISLGGYWEFPGGRIESGETAEECAVRELREAMSMHIETGGIFSEIEYDYGDRLVRLTAVRALLLGGRITLHDHDDIRWVTVSEMEDYLFAPADELIVNRLLQEYRKGKRSFKGPS